jgi:hypothetical protein
MFQTTDVARLALALSLLIAGCWNAPVAMESDTGIDTSDTSEQLPVCSEVEKNDREGLSSTFEEVEWEDMTGQSGPVLRCLDALHFQEGQGKWGRVENCPPCEVCVMSEWQGIDPLIKYGECLPLQGTQAACEPCKAREIFPTLAPTPWCDDNICVLQEE